MTARTTQSQYLDYAASAPERRESLAAERAYEESPIAGANPNSLHTPGREAACHDGARRDIARCVGGGFRPSDVIFTSGGAENQQSGTSRPVARRPPTRSQKRTRVVLSAIGRL